MSDKNIALSSTSLSIGYLLKGGKKKLVHKDLNLELRVGELTCLLGLNGAGKSTLLRTLCGFQPLLQGSISLFNKPIFQYSTQEFALKVGVVLTEKTNAGGITVYDLVSLGRHPYTGFFGKLGESDHKVIEDSLKSVGMIHKSSNYVSELSDGEKQKVMIAKVLAQECQMIVLDEPTAFLDITSRLETMVLLRRLATESGKAILLSTHDIDTALQMADSLWLLSKEQFICGTPNYLVEKGEIGRLFDRDGISFNPISQKFEIR